MVEPKEDETLMVCLIGCGYQSPSVNFKYCVRRLKINPARIFLENVFVTEGSEETCLVLGSRDNESGTRKRSLTKFFGDDLTSTVVILSVAFVQPVRSEIGRDRKWLRILRTTGHSEWNSL